ncbi:hypothetical protein EBB79_07195 [Parasedimentitalea marina]|uniref:DUF5343 domain-containing protein n=1 Tax=Parasedimentitalea marina TaxID=2483033 RepID=A0A3T0N112_9RHOB|nr:hypothetical protein EBB79_07195 [Parasedimentitalea marina]
MASLPYVTAAGNIAKAFESIRTAAIPPKVSQDFVKNVLKVPGGSGDQMTTYLKKIGFTGADGSPTDRYRRFRNPGSSGAVVAESIRDAYQPLYMRNEYLHTLPEAELTNLVMEETGNAHDSTPVKSVVNCIKALKEHADFNGAHTSSSVDKAEYRPPEQPIVAPVQEQAAPNNQNGGIGLNLGYTINLNLPATTDQEVFNAIFRSLKQNLLSSDDG